MAEPARGRTITAAGVLALGLLASPASGEEPTVIGGLTPSVRPAGFPAIRGIHNGVNWYRSALTGVSEPYPRSLGFLDNQGEWHTPFNRPGMPGVYDLRGWHGRR